jgi:hypothetical protein
MQCRMKSSKQWQREEKCGDYSTDKSQALKFMMMMMMIGFIKYTARDRY